MAGLHVVLMWGCAWAQAGEPVANPAPATVENSIDVNEFWIRDVALDPEGTRESWSARLNSSDWLQVYDVFDAMQRCPEAAQWFCRHEKDALRAGLQHPRSTVRAAVWRVIRMGQGWGEDCADWSRGLPESLGEESRAWRAAALSEAGLGVGPDPVRAYRSILTELAQTPPQRAANGLSKEQALAATMGFNLDEAAPELWWQGPQGEGEFRGLAARDLQLLVNPSSLARLRERSRHGDPRVRFRVECLALAQALFGGGTSEIDVPIDWDSLERGIVQPPVASDGDGAQWSEWNGFVTQAARLGSERLSGMFWTVALHPETRLSPEALQSFGGVDFAVESYVRWAVDSAPPGVSLDRALTKSPAIQEWVWGALEGDWRPIPWNHLEPWLLGSPGVMGQELAVSRLCEAPASEERRTLLLSVVEHSSGESLRRAFRALASSPDRGPVGAKLHRIWRDQEFDVQQSLLRELPNSPAWVAFAQDWLEIIREPGPCDLLVLEHLVHLPKASQWRALLERDFSEALEARFSEWERGEEPVSRDLARRAAALYRVQATDSAQTRTPISANPLCMAMLRRIAWMESVTPEEVDSLRYDFSKACIALLALEPEFVDWVSAHRIEVQTWPLRLRVEVGLQLPPSSYAAKDSSLRAFVQEVGRSDYPLLGEVLKERWLADPARAGALLESEAQNRRASTNIRQIAMSRLADIGAIGVLLTILEEDTGVTGPQLATESLAALDQDGIDGALRQRWLRAQRASQGNGADREIEAHLATEIMGTLVQRGALGPKELSGILDGPMDQRLHQWEQRLSGVATEQDWGPERRVLEQVALRGELSGLLQSNPAWSSLDGRLLARLARMAWSVRDQEATRTLARWAEVALAGEPDANGWQAAELDVRLLRFQVAQARGDSGLVAWYSECFVQDILAGVLRASGPETDLGGFDLREGNHAVARLCALRLQALAMEAASEGDRERALQRLGWAQSYCGTSQRALEQQARATRWVHSH